MRETSYERQFQLEHRTQPLIYCRCGSTRHAGKFVVH